MVDLRWGFAGGGNVTEAKASPRDAFTQPGSRVVAVARSDRERSEQFARTHGIPRAHGSVEELFADPEVDAVYVCTPHDLHRAHALAAIRAGKHVLCEKPLAPTTLECVEIVRAAEEAGVVLAAAYYRRFYPVIERLKQVVDSGRLGRITSARVISHARFVPTPQEARTDRRTVWKTRVQSAGGGALADNGSHVLDLLIHLLGEPRTVAAEIERFETSFAGEDHAAVTLRFESRAIALLEQSWCNRVGRGYLSVTGTEGDAVVEDLEAPLLVVTVGRDRETVETAPRARATHAPLVADFVRAVREGTPPRCTGAEALLTTQVIELAYQAAFERQTVDVLPVL